MTVPLEFGLDTFRRRDARTRRVSLSARRRCIRNVVEEAVLADESASITSVSANIIGPISRFGAEGTDAAIAGRTQRIRLGSAVTVLSSDDPVRVFQRFSTLNAVSNGRAEVMLGRGSSPSRFRFSDTSCRTTRRCSKRSSACSPPCSGRSGDLAGQERVPPLTNQRVFPADRKRRAEDLDRRSAAARIGACGPSATTCL